jgi:hypothetical protein
MIEIVVKTDKVHALVESVLFYVSEMEFELWKRKKQIKKNGTIHRNVPRVHVQEAIKKECQCNKQHNLSRMKNRT